MSVSYSEAFSALWHFTTESTVHRGNQIWEHLLYSKHRARNSWLPIHSTCLEWRYYSLNQRRKIRLRKIKKSTQGHKLLREEAGFKPNSFCLHSSWAFTLNWAPSILQRKKARWLFTKEEVGLIIFHSCIMQKMGCLSCISPPCTPLSTQELRRRKAHFGTSRTNL